MDLRVFLKLDGSGFQQGLTKATQSVSQAAKTLTKNFAGLFTVGAVSMMGKEVMQLASQYTRLSLQTGLSTDKVQELAFAAKMSDSDVSTLARTYGRLSKKISEARAGSIDAVNALNRVGVSTQNIESLSPDAAFKQIAAGMADIGDETERSAALMAIFDRNAEELKPLLKELGQGMEQYRNQVKLTREEIETLDKAGDKYAAMWENVKVSSGKTASALEQVHLGLAEYIDALLAYAGAVVSLDKNTTLSERVRGAESMYSEHVRQVEIRKGNGEFVIREGDMGRGGKEPFVNPPKSQTVDLWSDENKALAIQEQIQEEIYNRELDSLSVAGKKKKITEEIARLQRLVYEERFQGNESKAAGFELDIERSRTALKKLGLTTTETGNTPAANNDSLLAVGNFLGARGDISGIAQETNKILREHTSQLKLIAQNTNRTTTDLGIP
jgi:uncharacterized protein YukE